MKLDLRDLDCPIPVLRTKEALDEMEEGILDVELNSLSSIENVKRFVASQGLFFVEKKLEKGHVVLSIAKGYECELPANDPVEHEGSHEGEGSGSESVNEALRAAQIAQADRERREARTFYSLLLGGLVSAILASTCCLGPLLFLLFGVSVGSLGFLQAFAPYHAWFSGIALLLIAYLWFDWWRSRRKRVACATSLCRHYTLYLSLGTLFVTILVSYPWWVVFLMED